jgi:hypothetical protein
MFVRKPLEQAGGTPAPGLTAPDDRRAGVPPANGRGSDRGRIARGEFGRKWNYVYRVLILIEALEGTAGSLRRLIHS